jgi:hypothetical protein
MKRMVLLCVLLFSSAAIAEPAHWPVRNAIIANMAGTIGQGRILMLGDSITEMFWWNLLQNTFVLNAGQGGAGIDQVIATAQAIVPIAKPKVATLMVGINDCMIGHATNPVAWGQKYADLLVYLHAQGVVPVVLTILPVEQNPALPLGVKLFDQSCQAALNSQIYTIAVTRGEVLVNLNYDFAVAPTYKYMRPGWTNDGVHLYGLTAWSAFYANVNAAIAIALQKTP